MFPVPSASAVHLSKTAVRVEDLRALVKVLKEEGRNVLERIDESDYGKFAWVIDPKGNKIDLWEPPSAA